MPTYTYRCSKCGAETEAVQSMADPPLRRCKACRGALRRTYQSVGIVLKGAGFHRNDYRVKEKTSGDGEKPSEKKDTSETKTKTEATSAASDKSSGTSGGTSGSGESSGSKKKAPSDG